MATEHRNVTRMWPRKVALVVLVSCTCLEIIGLFSFVVYWKGKRHAILTPRESTICIPHLDAHSSDQTLDKESRCGTARTILERVVNKTVETRFDNNAYPEMVNATIYMDSNRCRKRAQTNEKLYLAEITTYGIPVPGKPTKLFWKQSKPVENLLHLEDEGVVVIRKAGLYFISSQLTSWAERDDKDIQEHRHFVILISRTTATETPFLESTVANCAITEAEAQKTNKMEGVFSLEENDRIYVAYSHPHKLACEDVRNHLMIFRL